MKVAEARSTYSAQLRSYHEQKFKLAKQRQELDEKIKTTENGSVIYANEAATLELVYNAVEEKQNEYQEYMDQLMGQWTAKFNEVASKQQADAAKDVWIRCATEAKDAELWHKFILENFKNLTKTLSKYRI